MENRTQFLSTSWVPDHLGPAYKEKEMLFGEFILRAALNAAVGSRWQHNAMTTPENAPALSDGSQMPESLWG